MADGRARPAGSLGGAALSLSLSLLVFTTAAAGYTLDTTSVDSIKSTAASMAKNMLSFYHGNEPGNTPGLLPSPYYWWEAGAMMGSLIDYWYYTGDATYNDLTSAGLLFQTGPNDDYMPLNQTLTEGNDDQGFWGLAAMTAAEYKFPDPGAGRPGWLALAQAVFNTQAARWESADCSGGLRWQIFTWNNGYDYKNSISQACFFNLAARLLLYTGNATYGDWAAKTWDWMAGVKFLDDNYYVYDGAHIESNCTEITPYQWTYNAGAFLLGAAAMYNYTALHGDQDGAALWRERVDGLLNGTAVFFTTSARNIMTEVACETVNLCDLDQQSFKAYLSRWMAATTKWAPWTAATIVPRLQASAVAAAAQCTGGDNGEMCGLRWIDNGTWDGTTGVGQQMAAMEVTLATMIAAAAAPVTNATGGTSQGNPDAGGSDIGKTQPDSTLRAITTGDRVGAGILTALFVLGVVAGVVYVLVDETADRTRQELFGDFVAAVGKNGKKLARRAAGGGRDAYDGEGIGGVASEKGKQPRVQSFRVIDRSDSDRSSGSVVAGDGAAESEAAPHHTFFSPAHFRRQSGGPGQTGAPREAPLSDPAPTTVVQSPPAAARPSALRPGPPGPPGAADAASSPDPPNKTSSGPGGKRQLIKRKLLQTQQQ